MDSYEAERLVSENLILLEEDIKLDARRRSSSSGKSEATSFKGRISVPNEVVDDAPIYFRQVFITKYSSDSSLVLIFIFLQKCGVLSRSSYPLGLPRETRRHDPRTPRWSPDGIRTTQLLRTSSQTPFLQVRADNILY